MLTTLPPDGILQFTFASPFGGKMRGQTRIALLFTLGLASQALSNAAPAFIIDTTSIPNSILATALVSGGGVTLDVRGVAQIDIFTTGFTGAVLLADSAGGTGGFSNPAFGNNFLVASNFATQTGFVGFDFFNPVLTNGGTTLTLTGTGVPIDPVPITDPALSQIMTTLDYNFQFLSTSDLGGATAAIFGLSSITLPAANFTPPAANPEPGTAGLILGAGMLAFAGLRRKMRRP
jgi:hypothetical protein